MRNIKPLFLSSLLAVILIGCNQSKGDQKLPFTEDTSVRKTVIAQLKSMKTDDFRKAFERAAHRNHQSEVDLRVLDTSGAEAGREVRTLKFVPKQPPVVRSTIQSGLFKSGNIEEVPITDITFPALFLPDPNAMQSAQFWEKYLYRQLADRTLPFGTVHVFEMVAHPNNRTTPEITQLRYFITKKDQKLVGVEIKRTIQNFIFAEQSFGTLLLQPVAGTWLPIQARFTLLSQTLFLSPQNLSIRYRYAYEG
ncbi:MAG: hypothetical protein JNN12_02700 [Bacteroidetes Order II. Incertae sedis bacterium]|nr:hypothetical protein [Bacteroidetes Order II. bacterium]